MIHPRRRMTFTPTVIVTACAFVCPVQGLAAGINMQWNDCPLGLTATRNRDFACDTNTGSHLLVASFDPPAGLTMVTGVTGHVVIQSETCPLNSWWQFYNPGACRQSVVSADVVVREHQGACADYWHGLGTTEVTAIQPYGNNYRLALIEVTVAIPDAYAGPVEPGTEYYAFNLVIRNTKSVGTGACAGCAEPMCLMLLELGLNQPPGTPGGSPYLSNPIRDNYATWQGGSFCTCVHCYPPAPCATPVFNETWGQIKSLYR